VTPRITLALPTECPGGVLVEGWLAYAETVPDQRVLARRVASSAVK
jgi:hypothetical protein